MPQEKNIKDLLNQWSNFGVPKVEDHLSPSQYYNVAHDVVVDSNDEYDEADFQPATESVPVDAGFEDSEESARQQNVAYSDSGAPVGPEGGFRAGQAGGSPSASAPSQLKPNVSSARPPLADIIAHLDRLRGEEKSQVQDLNALMGGNQIAQAIASGSGGKIGDGNEQVNKLREAAQQPGKDYKDLIKLYKDSMGTIRPSQQTGWMGRDPVTKKLYPLTYDPNIKMYTKPDGTPMPNDYDMLRSSMTTDSKSNKVAMGSNGVEIVQSSARPESTEDVNTKYSETKAFNPDAVQVKALDSETKRLDSLTKDLNARFDSVDKLEASLASGNKLTGSMVKSQMPRLAGEVGNLNQMEQDAWAGSKALYDRIEQYLTGIAESDISPENKRELSGMVEIFKNSTKKSKNSIMSASANRLNMVHKIPAEFTLQSYGDIRSDLKAPPKFTPEQIQSAKKILADPNLKPEKRKAIQERFGL